MARIRASCDTCGDVELGVDDVTVQAGERGHDATYAFHCPHCEVLWVRAAAERTVELLVAAGVDLVRWHLPAELDDDRGHADPITHDELLDFHQHLADDQLLAASLDSLSAR